MICLKSNLYEFSKKGYSVFTVPESLQSIQEYSINWLYEILPCSRVVKPTLLHKLSIDESAYSISLCQSNRHRKDNSYIYYLIKLFHLEDILDELAPGWEIWDEGFGSLGLRVVRPNSNDGYKWSRKSWGPAKSVYSASITCFMDSADASIKVIPRSHVIRDLPTIKENSIHCKDELRLDTISYSVTNAVIACNQEAQLLLTHPDLIHTEENSSTTSTRISLEFRIKS